jgi:cytochrome c553
MRAHILLAILLTFSLAAIAQTGMDEAMALYKGTENLDFSAERGKEFWNTPRTDENGKERSCNTCHGKDLTKTGKHIKTGKKIEPMAPSVNKERYTDLKKIEKWFKRNCKWTIGRECTNQEKGDVLSFLSGQ